VTSRKLYFISGSPPCWSMMLALEVKSLAYTPQRLDNAKREQKSPEYLAINPRGEGAGTDR
jgi:glutathione S-transferase